MSLQLNSMKKEGAKGDGVDKNLMRISQKNSIDWMNVTNNAQIAVN